MVFTQYTDTMDFLRDYLAEQLGYDVLCFSGRGGELRNQDGSWRIVSRDEVKRLFREREGEVLLCTDAAAEGLNFQFCGALVNYEMPWNPMRIEQRIGRIDRLGQENHQIRVLNLHYRKTVETDVYMALRDRIGLFSRFVGKLQPILARLPQSFAESTLSARPDRERKRSEMICRLEEDVRAAERSAFDLDEIMESDLEEPLRPPPLYDLQDLDRVIQHQELLPPGL
jgi:ERCC4-related helicase